MPQLRLHQRLQLSQISFTIEAGVSRRRLLVVQYYEEKLVAEAVKLPGSSYEELTKIIAAYSNVAGEAGPADVGKLVGVDQTTISRNNGFLSAVGLLEEVKGGKKRATDLGRDLGRALEHNLSDRVQESWRTVVTRNEFMRQLISAVRIRHGMDTASFLSHVGYSAGQPRGGRTALGGRTILAILVAAGVVQSADGKIVAVTTLDAKEPQARSTSRPSPSSSEPVVLTRVPRSAEAAIQVVVQVNITITPNELHGLGSRLRRELDELQGLNADPVESDSADG